MSDNRYPLFPLHTVLFPGGRLPLQIFEQRYLRLVRDCLRDNSGFATVLISEGREVADRPQIYHVGCEVAIIDWETLDNGLLGITIEARRRLRLSRPGVRDDGLLLADGGGMDAHLDDPHAIALPDQYLHLLETLDLLMQHPYAKATSRPVDRHSAFDVCFRLCELLPISNERKQFLLEVPDIGELLAQVHMQIEQFQSGKTA